MSAASSAKMAALRALAEGVPATFEILADVSGRTPGALRKQAEREGWLCNGTRDDGSSDRVRSIASQLLDRLERMGREAGENGATIDKAEIDGISALVRSLEKIGEVMRPQEAANKNQTRHDENLADALDLLNDRIVELARSLAATLAADETGPLAGEPDAR